METITNTALNTPALSILVSALQFVDSETGSDLVNTLANDEVALTVFAPSNAAFGQLAADLGFDSDPADADAVTGFLVANVPAETIRDIILYHVLDEVKTSTDLAADEEAGAELTTLNGATITPDLPTLADKEPDLPDPSLVDGLIDIEATNGVVHVIDRVLLPEDLPGNDAPTLAGIVAASGEGFDDNGSDFDILLAAVGAAGLVETLSSDEVDLTVFAPTDYAFISLAADLGFDGSDEAGAFSFIVDALTGLADDGDPIPLLTDVLLYHVVGESLQSSQIAADGQVTTLQGGTITLNGTTLEDGNPDLEDPSLIATDIQASNGVAQVIDRVLIPEELLRSDDDDMDDMDDDADDDDGDDNDDVTKDPITATALATPALSILVSALQFVDSETGSDLVNTLADDDGAFTVFAPSNAAFGQLAADLGFDGDPADADAVTSFLVTNVAAETIRDIILYHVLGEVKTSADLAADEAAGSDLTTLNGATISPDLPTLGDNEPDLPDPSLVDGLIDIDASNGVVHVIDRVLLPEDLPGNDAPTLAGIVTASGEGFDENGADFDILLTAVGAAGLVETLSSAEVDLTVFAPTDDAFISLAADLGFQGSDEAGAFGFIVDALTLLSGGGDPIPLLTDILLYHVAGEGLQFSQITADGQVTTLQGGTFTVDGDTLLDGDPDLADPTLIATDIQASNGVAQVIDRVLIPLDVLQSDGSDDVDFVIGDDTAETIRTGKDSDFIDGNGGNDFIRAGRGDDVALGGDGNDNVGGGRGNDMLDGGAGRDIIKGGAGDDIITGGADSDLLFGGRGADTFVFKQGDGADRIFTFGFGDDKIDLSDFGLSGFEDIADQITEGTFKASIDLGPGDHLSVISFGGDGITADDFIF